ncbi:uncharacterized protein [Littorina saxatilis]|uniref:Transmembrane protein n=1 Tax=Littorina saxatilis TaxID=31220 RepID=A0AAN9BXQ2_9CAEN
MKRWWLRHRGFRVAFVCAVASSVFFIVAFASPAWTNTKGLWMECSPSHWMCATHHRLGNQLPAWFDAVRGFECLALVAIILCVMEELYIDFLTQPSPDRRVAEVLALAAGTLGLVGCILFAAFTPVTGSGSRGITHSTYLSWGFGLATTSSCFLIAFASVIAYFRHRGLDVLNYAASNAVHYNASDDVVGVTNVDMSPPSYTEAMNHPGGSQGTAAPLSSEYAYFKRAGFPEVQPPPYFPPPPGAQFEAPPPYAAVQIPAVSRQATEGSSPAGVLPAAEVNAMSVSVNPGVNIVDASPASSMEGPRPQAAESAGFNPTMSVPPSLPQPQSPVSAGLNLTSSVPASLPHSAPVSAGINPVISVPSSVPAYYVTVLGQMVPVYLEELQQAGRDVPSSSDPIPAYFIMIHGQHVPVYSEEQAAMLNN